MTKVFIDGSAGTTGLRIHERLSARTDITLLTLPEEVRKDPRARADALNGADIAFLCLPDAAAREAAGWLQNGHTVLIDTSTAHRTALGWVYGFPELRGARERICASRRIANPGCHASGFIALAAPLVTCGLLSPKSALSCFSLTGYSGGGKQMIAQYESGTQDALLAAPWMYGLGQAHKHLPEMAMYAGLETPPVFCPTVAPFYAGMEVTVPLHRTQLSGGLDEIRAAYRDYYSDGLVRFAEAADEDGFLSAAAFAGRDDMQITVTGNEERILLVCRFDNLGKGASGAAIQNMNLLLGLPEDTGLNVPAEAAI
ncbi:MAG: N-acetyl-gamma-glutamyl-phosphate reductase [Oscillospiraceae bacterium]|nr:N-acetyl-gamma-glutamyl-phosphate reductase [Oscillospiraceae bacterium]